MKSFQKNLKYRNIVSKILKNFSFRLAVVDSKLEEKSQERKNRKGVSRESAKKG